jgi:cell fate (sporulation/competence/biofilm development) regulator YmcA (YheA/YmcA/DUF963 family)
VDSLSISGTNLSQNVRAQDKVDVLKQSHSQISKNNNIEAEMEHARPPGPTKRPNL